MCKLVPKFLLCFVATVGVINIPIGVNVGAQQDTSRAEAFRKSLSAKNMIVPNDPKLGSARYIAIIVEMYSESDIFSLERCGLKGFRDTPDYASPEYLNTFAVKLRGKNPYQDISDRAACTALRNNCVTIGTSIFCDYDFLLRLRNLARAAYFYAQMAIKQNMSPLIIFDPELLTMFGNSQLELQQISVSDEPEYSPIERGVARYARENSSMMVEMMEFIALGHIIAHELAHIEQNKNVEATIPELEQKAQEYYDLICHTSISKRELKADLRGIEMAAKFMEWHNAMYKIGLDTSVKGDSVLIRMWEQKTVMGIFALLKIFEYELIVGQHPEDGIKAVSAEPLLDKGTLEMTHYYSEFGWNRVHKENDMFGQVFTSKHMDFSYRSVLLLEKAGIKDYFTKEKLSSVPASPRYLGYTVGRLAALQEIQCGKSIEDALDVAWDFLIKSFGVQ